MQTLWSRALQVKRSCRCLSCARPPQKALARRLATGSAPQRFGDIFSVCFSSIIVTAAAADAKQKQTRRHELIGAIREAKEELDALDQDQLMRLEALGISDCRDYNKPREGHSFESIGWSTEQGDIKLESKSWQEGARMQSIPPGFENHLQLQLQRGRRWPRIYPPKIDDEETPETHSTPLSHTLITTQQQDVPTCSPITSTYPTKDRQRKELSSDSDTKSLVSLGSESLKNRELGLAKENSSMVKVPHESLSSLKRKEQAKLTGSREMHYEKLESQSNGKLNLAEDRRASKTHQKRAKTSGVQALEQLEKKREVSAANMVANPHHFPRNYYWAKVDRTGVSLDTLMEVLLDSRRQDPHLGRPMKEVWDLPATPLRNRRNVLQSENAMSTLIYEIVLANVNRTDAVHVSLPDGTTWNFTKEHTLAIVERLKDLSHRRSVLITASADPRLMPMIKPLGVPAYMRTSSLDREKGLYGVAQQEEDLLDLFSTPMEANEMISRLCSTLACQRFCPNVHIFNILIIQLCHLQLHKLAKFAVEAMFECGVEPNEVSHAAILNCYAALAEEAGFQAYINKMEGVPGRGLLRADSKQHEIEKRAPESKIFSHRSCDRLVLGFQPQHTEPKVLSYRAPRTQYIYEAIISGYLKLSKIGLAIDEYAKMLRHGFQPTELIYRSFLRHCVKTKSWRIGRLLWHHYNDGTRVIDAAMYYWMLQLCAFCERSQEFQSISIEAFERGIIDTPLQYEHFVWSEKDYLATMRYSDAVERLRENMWVPGAKPLSHDIEYKANPTKSCPGNLFTLVHQQLLNLVHWKEVKTGFCVDLSFREQAKLLAAESPKKQWVEFNLSSRETVLRPGSDWMPAARNFSRKTFRIVEMEQSAKAPESPPRVGRRWVASSMDVLKSRAARGRRIQRQTQG